RGVARRRAADGRGDRRTRVRRACGARRSRVTVSSRPSKAATCLKAGCVASDELNLRGSSDERRQTLGPFLGVPHDAALPLAGGTCSHEEGTAHPPRRDRAARPRPRWLDREQRAPDARLRLRKDATAMATIEYPSVSLRDDAPPKVADEFIL